MARKKICFCHYGIGWRDGVNMSIFSLAREIAKKNQDVEIYFLGGEIKEKRIKNAVYLKIPELLPPKRKLKKRGVFAKAEIIAKKLGKYTQGIDRVIVENPLMGGYHLPAMIGYFWYGQLFKNSATKLYFHVHDFYKDSPIYLREIKSFFSQKEIRKILKNGEGVDGFLIVNRNLEKKLIKEGIPKKKIFYLPNGIVSEIFSQPLKIKERKLIYQKLRIPNNLKFFLYPVRIVPRKNIEEAILLTKRLREITKENYGVVVSGKVDLNDPRSKIYYQKLRKIKVKEKFPIIFVRPPLPLERKYDNAGKIKKFSIGDLYQASEAILMTSLREGFGYPFLECWFSRKIVIGRRIEEIIKDFEKSGLKFWWLYKKFSFGAIKKQADILQNKEKREKIIENNLKVAKEVYEASRVTDRFLELINLK